MRYPPDKGLLASTAPILLALLAFGVPGRTVLAAGDDPHRQRAYTITDFAAQGDGKTSNTDAFKKAIDACAAAGGGRVVVPAGTFLTGPVELKSHVDLHLDDGAVVLFSRNLNDYPLVPSNWEGRDTIMCQSPIHGHDLQDVSITGGGTIDAQGDAWRPVKQAKLNPEQWTALVKSGGYVDESTHTWYPSRAVVEGQGELKRLRASKEPPRVQDYEKLRELLRPSLLLLSNCRGVVLDGPTFRNSPSWNLHLLLCDNVALRNLTVFNPAYAQNGDGMDLDACRNVVVADCKVDAGDDGICLKSGRDEEGRRRGRPTENVTITRCTVGHAHGGVVIGSEMSGGIRNITISDCAFHGTDTGLRFKSARGRGGTVENVNVSNIVMSDIASYAITFNMYYMAKSPRPEPGEAGAGRGSAAEPAAEPVSEKTPVFRQFHITNVVCESAGRAVEIRGLPEMPIEDIVLENVRIAADQGAAIVDAKDVTLRDVTVRSRALPVFKIQNATGLTMDHVAGLHDTTAGRAIKRAAGAGKAE
jgi:DNA sulfur modification protein DndE